MRKHHELKVWQEGMDLVREVYKAATQFPQHEKFCLTAPLRRAAISIPSNIAEGAARNSSKEFVHFLVMARGSLSELETQILIAKDMAYLAEEGINKLLTKIDSLFALLGGLLNSLRKGVLS